MPTARRNALTPEALQMVDTIARSGSFAAAARGLPQQPIDNNLLAALEAGLPDCSGVALGVDRVVMLALGAESIGEVIAFTVDRA